MSLQATSIAKTSSFLQKSHKGILSALVLLLVGALAGWMARGTKTPAAQEKEEDRAIRLNTHHEFPLINPLLLCSISEKKESQKFEPLEKKLTALIRQYEEQGNIDLASVYFRDLDSGRWVGVNEDEQYSAASLDKVPVLMAYLKVAETKPDILKETIVYQGGDASDEKEYFKPPAFLKAGKSYTVEELLRRMIAYSGNVSTNLLFYHLNADLIKEVYTDLGIPVPRPATDTSTIPDSISAKTYSIFFRVLYSATFVSRELSEKALELLSNSNFTKGIVAGLPSRAVVAHKFGERTLVDTSGSVVARELHDCGIVYATDHPYFLCVMTRGGNFNALGNFIAEVSRTAYETNKEFGKVIAGP